MNKSPIAFLRLVTLVGALLLNACMLEAKFSSLASVANNSSQPLLPVVDPVAPVAPPKCNTTITANFGGGDGSATEPYVICNIFQWNYLALNPPYWTKSFKLASDLDFTGVTYSDFYAVKDATAKFSGVFDGGDFKIKNILLNAGVDDFSLFGNTTGSPTFKNLIIENINVTTSGAIATLVNIHDVGGTITLDHLTLKTAAYSNPASGFIVKSFGSLVADHITINGLSSPVVNRNGGIIGALQGDGTFSSIAIDGYTQSYACCGSPLRAGGLIGSVDGSPAAVTISVTSSSLKNIYLGGNPVIYSVGGIVGETYDAVLNVTDTQISGTIYAKDAGGIAGVMANASTTASHFSSLRNTIDIAFLSIGNGSGGGLVGSLYCSGNVDKTVTKGSLDVWTGNAGGLIGRTQTTSIVNLSDSYSTMTLSKSGGSGSLGGLIGAVASSGTLNLARSYYTGVMALTGGGGPYKGCLVAKNFATLVVTDSYYDSSICLHGSVDSGAYAGTTGLSTGSLQTATPFTNWLALDWIFASGANPKLSWEP